MSINRFGFNFNHILVQERLRNSKLTFVLDAFVSIFILNLTHASRTLQNPAILNIVETNYFTKQQVIF